MTKIFSTLLATIFISTTFAQKWNYFCQSTESVINHDINQGVSLSCYCTATYLDQQIELKCDAKNSAKGQSCSNGLVHSNDNTLSASIVDCSTDGATIETSNKSEVYQKDSFKFTCISRGDGKFCRGSFAQA
ncbi:hypothetical protein K502DRAFT_218849 [Neoconidiobolus thromboides FSU 785]|nr:hypothetical protein K502DRAFT_218849 [Neoconidiobolus thromboides FSU 785]